MNYKKRGVIRGRVTFSLSYHDIMIISSSFREIQETEERKVKEVHLDHKDHRDHKDPGDSKDPKEQLDHRVPKALMVLLGNPV